MFKTYQKYIFYNFLNKLMLISLVFFILVVILNIFEEISFFKNTNSNFFLPYLITLLNAPITMFEIFPFIFLITTQYFFYDIFRKDELFLFKSNGLSNFKIIKNLFGISLILGFLMIIIYYNFASSLKFYYTDLKNNYSNDNKYLAVVNDSGIWIKDEIDQSIIIIKSTNIKKSFLIDVIINQFDINFNHLKTIQSAKIDISNKKWIIYDPVISEKNISSKSTENIFFKSNFDEKKINSLFSNFSTLNLLELFNLKKDYESIGYSSDEILIHLLRLVSTPFFYSLMTVLSAIIMFNIKRNKPLFFHILLGILISVIIYYLNFMFASLGITGKIPPNIAVLLPILFISIISTIGLIKINEK
jgi:lipopolysaccharide export system permease protein